MRPKIATRPPTRWPGLGEGALLILFAGIAYWPVLSCGFIWDDDDYVEHNKALESPAGLVRIWTEPTASPQYYPLVFTTFWIERRFYALDPAGYHAVNVLLHAASGLLLWRILLRLAVPAAWFAAALFVLHPVEVESVAWITERKNVLSGVFYLASALCYLRFRPPDREGSSWGWYAASLALFACALLSKTVTCSLPAALILVYWWKRLRLGWRDIVPLVPMFVLGVALAGVTVWMEKYKVGAGTEGAHWDLSAIDRILIAGRAVCFYLGKLVWPIDLTFIYPRWTIDSSSAEQWVYPIAVVVVLAALLFARHRLGKGPLVAMLFFVGTLLPALGFINTYPMRFSFVADHFQYLASIGPLTLMAVAGKAALEFVFEKKPGMPPLIGAAWLVALGVLTWGQISIYDDRVVLWTDTLRKNPDCWIGHHNLADAIFEKQGDLEEVRKHYEEAIRIDPGDWSARYGIGRTYWVERATHPEKALPWFEEAVRLKPDYLEARFNLAGLLQKTGKIDEAIEQYEKAIAIKPDYVDAHNNLGVALVLKDRTAAAIPHFELVVQAQPEKWARLLALATAYQEVGRLDDARAAARKGIERFPQMTQFRTFLDSLK